MKQDFTTKDGVLTYMSSFWSSVFPDQGFSQGIGRNFALEMAQVYQDALEIINTSSVHDVPIYHREKVVPLNLLKSQMSIGPLPIRYGKKVVYGDQPAGSIYPEGDIFEYGDKERLALFYYFPLPDDVKSIGSVVTERLVNPKVLLAKDRDFITLENRVIAFERNPFESGEFPIRTSADDQQAIAWLHEVHTDKNYLHRRWGSPFFSNPESSEALREFCKTMFALYSGGPSRLMLDSFVAAMARQPVIAEQEETVEEIGSINGEMVVVTDKSTYRMPLDAPLRSRVVPGAVLRGGFPLTDVTRVDDILSDPKWWQTEGGLTMDRGLQHPKYYGGPIFFPNAEVEATVSGDESARFSLAGSPEALEKFWEKVDQGSPEGGFLGTELWKRYGVTDSDGNPDFTRPVLLNPMEFLVKDVMRASIIGVRVDGNRLIDTVEFLENLENLRRGTTPIALLVFFIDYQLSGEYDSPGDATELTLATGLGVYEDAIDLVGFEETLNVKQSIAC